MFDISWGETFVLTGLTITFIGRKDLPAAANLMGKQVGRIVGFLQGVRARADQFATGSNELQLLQSELRSNLRELDAVKGEFAVAASSRHLIGRQLANSRGGMPSNMSPSMSAARSLSNDYFSKNNMHENNNSQSATQSSVVGALSGMDYLSLAREAEAGNSQSLNNSVHNKAMHELAPRTQAVAAIAEEEWIKQGIGFKSKAELGNSLINSESSREANSNKFITQHVYGSTLLSDIIQQNLIHDQYDRVVLEQDEILRNKIDKMRNPNKNQ